MKDIFFGTNAIAALVGWLAWTVLMLSIYKDDNEKTFNLKAYAGEHWDNWAASLVFVPILLWVGYKKLNFAEVGIETIGWNDLYYLASGFAPEIVKMSWKKWRAKNAVG